MTIAHVVFL